MRFEQCEMVMLDDWKYSRGARVEQSIASGLGWRMSMIGYYRK